MNHDNLEEFSHPDEYDLEESATWGVEFYKTLAVQTGGPILEIACGTGRVSIPIASLGLAVTGLDIVPAMLERARQKSRGLDTRWLEGDARNFALKERFRLIYLTGNAFQAFLTRADQEALLGRVHAHLQDTGLFAFETRNPHWISANDPNSGDPDHFTNLETRGQEEFWHAYTDTQGRTVRVSGTQTYDHVAQILHWTTHRRWLEGNRERVRTTRIAVRYTFPQELAGLLHYNGFEVLRQYGDWSLEPLNRDSPNIILVCGKRPTGSG